ncbi:Alkyl hydroperoxide reductase/ Thiol specific antioxidant [Nitrosococcus oceani ATCC 19707]|uniref:thioredoxin-dependent peroxiredoxin n=2 Tax=Nitrosococcus oceani TaxID=1229 RepID=Q3J867_NITOC|nr:peroxiredoxin [Nitrosococcus oceani]ABA58979.1 Alkyl hydroperoxide reductase/ Thiol specific antioxidant [Nitrosococcus oceani ATCC 19707]EDZ65281.1 antioxidant, AhpC/TSA family [Nitrosococcus oceani AFC27]KFI18601.1 peroxiredoxin [Nitrosococcus oceani C-27]GEM18925.1 peroxiredoxin [Nitrosococcus oceani]
MTEVTIGKTVPDFELPATSGQTVKLSQLQGQNVVLYFYPKDDTPGCTREGQDFRDLHPEFKRLNTVIFGISRDTLKSHETFKAQQRFPFELLSDKDATVCRLFEVIKPKKMFGKDVKGIERSTFLIDQEGILREEWRKVKVEDHAAEVLAATKAL